MKPAGLVTKTKDNSRKKHRENAEWIKGKKIGRPKQQWVPAEIVSDGGRRMKCALPSCTQTFEMVWPVSHKKYCSDYCQQKAWRLSHKTRIAKQDRQRRLDHYEAVRAREKNSRAKHIEEHRAAGRNYWRRKQGLTSTETKSGFCEICDRFFARLQYDHSHETGEHRGWLCGGCNMKLEWYEKYHEQARVYLEKASRRPLLGEERREELVRRNEHEIRWIENELATKKLSPAQRGEYRHQIRKKELEIAFNGGNNA